ncbi:MAG TPA: S1 RNA-binding domain-containing protein [Thermoanaerobaculia bacterium]|nr:S1 RNA-binding domain-containing protein [Thermoanaerobaculia bacterium]
MSGDEESFEAALRAFEAEQATPARPALRVGEKIVGTIVSIEGDFAFVELGGKAEGQVPVEELRDAEGELLYQAGDTLEALITAEGADGALTLRVRPGRGQIAAGELRDAQRHRIPVEGRVAAINKGGAEVDVGGLRAFCPISQLADRFVEDPKELLNRRLSFLVTRFEDGGAGRRPNVVLSRRALLEDEKRQQAEETRAKLEVGAVLTGEVRSIVPFGAFVDLGGIEGLLHVSQMSHGRVADPAEVVEIGQRVEVEVLEIVPQPGGADSKGRRERISLSMRTLQQDPWIGISQRLAIGTTVSGAVTRVESFGAFVELEPGIEGLVHVSELGSEQRVQHAREVVSPGQEVRVRVLDVDPAKRRIALSIAAAVAAVAAREEAAEKADFERRSRERSSGLGSMGSALAGALGDLRGEPESEDTNDEPTGSGEDQR